MGLLDSFRDFLGDLHPMEGRLEVVEQTDQRCVVSSGSRQVVLDLTRRIADVGSAGRLPFAQFDSVDVERIQDKDDGTYWRVSLVPKLRGRMEVGTSAVDVDASIAAATLARHIGCPVKAF